MTSPPNSLKRILSKIKQKFSLNSQSSRSFPTVKCTEYQDHCKHTFHTFLRIKIYFLC